jgi:hypothetical protein
MCLLEGTNKGVGSLLEAGLHITKEMLRDAQLAYPRTPVRNDIIMQLIRHLFYYL